MSTTPTPNVTARLVADGGRIAIDVDGRTVREVANTGRYEPGLWLVVEMSYSGCAVITATDTDRSTMVEWAAEAVCVAWAAAVQLQAET